MTSHRLAGGDCWHRLLFAVRRRHGQRLVSQPRPIVEFVCKSSSPLERIIWQMQRLILLTKMPSYNNSIVNFGTMYAGVTDSHRSHSNRQCQGWTVRLCSGRLVRSRGSWALVFFHVTFLRCVRCVILAFASQVDCCVNEAHRYCHCSCAHLSVWKYCSKAILLPCAMSSLQPMLRLDRTQFSCHEPGVSARGASFILDMGQGANRKVVLEYPRQSMAPA
ncbi:hypothetical protein DFH29DRAFT_954383 [Suillus ampliporus]|nr:hypothetical protein DFH29DRAFT_954383 [Suillus ampliporus]